MTSLLSDTYRVKGVHNLKTDSVWPLFIVSLKPKILLQLTYEAESYGLCLQSCTDKDVTVGKERIYHAGENWQESTEFQHSILV